MARLELLGKVAAVGAVASFGGCFALYEATLRSITGSECYVQGVAYARGQPTVRPAGSRPATRTCVCVCLSLCLCGWVSTLY